MNSDTCGALVLFSCGQDTTTCLAWALESFDRIETVGFYYGQRHVIEMDSRAPLLSAIRTMNADWSACLGDNHVIDLGVLGHTVGGMCETDYSGYTNYRDVTMKSMLNALRLSMDTGVEIHTSLMWLDRVEWRLAQDLGERGERHYRGCGKCQVCSLRKKGWKGFTGEPS